VSGHDERDDLLACTGAYKFRTGSVQAQSPGLKPRWLSSSFLLVLLRTVRRMLTVHVEEMRQSDRAYR
jgi:hypothetical protein